MPAPLVVAAQHREAGPAPPVGKVARSPARLDAERDVAGGMARQREPLDAALDVALERVVAECEHAWVVAHVRDEGGAQVPQTPGLDFEEDASAEQRRR